MAGEEKIRAELIGNPAVYAGLNSEDAAAYMMDPANGSMAVPFISRGDLHNATDEAELNALTDAQARHYDRLLRLDQVGIGPGSTGRAVIARLFNDQSVTRAAVIALATVPASRAQIISAGRVTPGHIERARM